MSDNVDPEVIDRMLLDAEIHVAAAGIKDWLPKWLFDVTEQHHAEMHRLRDAGKSDAADVFETHSPLFEDGLLCSAPESSSVYPCDKLRAVHDGAGVWGEIVKTYPDGWEAATPACGEDFE